MPNACIIALVLYYVEIIGHMIDFVVLGKSYMQENSEQLGTLWTMRGTCTDSSAG